MIIFGVDPGTRITGYGIIYSKDRSARAIDFGCIKPTPTLKLSDRYLIIFESIELLLEQHKPDVLVVETQYVDKNVQSVIKLGMARGIVIIAAKRRGIPVFEYAPTQAKRAVFGNGRATKFQIQHMVKNLLGLASCPEPIDASDALSLALCHSHSCHLQQLAGKEI